eukprot:TRINITY_DN8541_c0_g1_i1.p1 TRINITY_DN8541_c0_g1~~TRINITY_DN8541_c0_g1_i1.p1  ORF type:complete len:434 (-),score=75.66 TRINITY_DN8541_c0_g1_i1:12-1220(-)
MPHYLIASDEDGPLMIYDEESPKNFKGVFADNIDDLSKILQFTYEFIKVEDNHELLTMVNSGAVDFGGTLSATSSRSKDYNITFSMTLGDSSLGIMVAGETGAGFDVFKFLKPLTWKLWLSGLGATVVMGHIVWIYQRIEGNREEFPKNYLSGIREGIYYSFMSLFKFGSVSLKGLPSRILMIGWSFFALMFVAAYTATLASLLTVTYVSSDINNLADLNGKRVGTIDLTTSYRFLTERTNSEKVLFDDEEDLLMGLETGEVRVIIYDIPIMRWWINTRSNRNDLKLLSTVLEKSGLSIAFRKDYASQLLLNDFNIAILQMHEQGMVVDAENNWLGDLSQAKIEKEVITDISHFSGVYAFLGIFIILSVLTMLLKVKVVKKKYKNSSVEMESQSKEWNETGV